MVFFGDFSLPLAIIEGEIPLDWLGQLIGILIGAIGITGLGIIIYCLILKVVTLPLDVWQRASMRKQNLKMESMRGQLEKLKVQYANNPELYQRKIQEVYKENNFNMLSSCLPMIVTLVVLMFAFSSLTAYSQHVNLQTYVGMSEAYNAAILDGHCVMEDVEGEPWEEDENYVSYKNAGDDSVYYIYRVEHKTDKTVATRYYVNAARFFDYLENTKSEEEFFDGVEDVSALFDDETKLKQYVESRLTEQGREAAAAYYRSLSNNEGISFLWIKNIYNPDVAWTNPLLSYKDFCNSINKKVVSDGKEISVKDFISETTYNEITANLSKEKTSPNGYFILVVLTILANLGSQFIAMRSQKAQRELQTADPAAESTQKMTMFLMPAIFCIFAFIYSAAFSLYLITSALFTTASTLVVNKVIDEVYKKKQAAESKQKGRVALKRDWKNSSDKDGKKK